MALPTAAAAAPGDLDPSFGQFGRLRVAGWQTRVLAGARLPDGRSAVALGGLLRVTVLMLEPDGSVDTTFGSQGIATPDPSRGYGDTAYGEDLVALPDGRILVAGRYLVPGRFRFFVARLDPDGELDTSFGDQGFALGPTTTNTYSPVAMAVGLDGEVYLADGGTLLAFTADGDPDGAFGAGGEVTTPLAGGYPARVSVVALPGGRVAVGGSDNANAKMSQATVARYLPDGTPDASFGVAGVSDDALGIGSGITALTYDPLRGLTAAATVNGLEQSQSVTLRYAEDGSLDQSYSGDGLSRIFGGVVRDLVIQERSAVLTGGSGRTAAFSLRRFRADGEADRSFGSRGHVRTDFAGHLDTVVNLLVDETGILAVGHHGTYYGGRSTYYEVALARYLNGGRTADADADGTADKTDRCRFVAARGHHGCPVFDRSVIVQSEGPGTFVHLESPARGCEYDKQVYLYRVGRGRDELIEALRAKKRADVHFDFPRRGDYYVRARRERDRRLGICLGDRSHLMTAVL